MWRLYVIVLTVLFVVWLSFFHIRDSFGKTKNIPDNFEKRPRIEHHVPKFMLELYDQIRTNPNITPPDVVKSIIPKNQEFEIVGDLNMEHNHFLLFELPKTNPNERFIKAELKILTLIIETEKILNNVDIIEHLLIISTYNDAKKIIEPIEKKIIFHRNNTWISFDLTNAVGEAIRENNIYLKLIISLKCFVPAFNGKLKLSLFPKEANLEHDYPILLLTYSSNKNETKDTNRPKRSVERELFERKSKFSCRRRPMYVNFSDIHYDSWIVQPRGYEAFQCQGKCSYPIAGHLSPTKHAIIQSLLQSLHPTKVSKICCVPTQLTSISILYVEGGILTYRYAYKDMVVTECGCR